MAIQKPDSTQTFNFTEYDFIGFDMDHTLCTYSLRPIYKHQYDFMSKFLRLNGYEIEEELSPFLIDFVSRGLVIDVDKGNLLKAAHDGEIIRASHGTRLLAQEEIVQIYGTEKKWQPLDDAVAQNFAGWKSKTSEIYYLMDFIDGILTVTYAQAINSGRSPVKVWHDVMECKFSMYNDVMWKQELFENKELYINKTSEEVFKWIRGLKERSKVALITSNCPIASPKIAEFALGPNWRSLFDIFIYDAKKPNFFDVLTPFQNLDGQETPFTTEGSYLGGCLQLLQETLTVDLKRSPRCLYIGDSPLHDFIWTDRCDCVAVLKELKTEGLIAGIGPCSEPTTSSFWGPSLRDGNKLTLLGRISANATFCTPDLSFLADKPLDFEHRSPFTALY